MDWKVGEEVWFVCIDEEVWLLSKGIIKEFPLETEPTRYPIAIINNERMKIDFHTNGYFKTKEDAVSFWRYILNG